LEVGTLLPLLAKWWPLVLVLIGVVQLALVARAPGSIMRALLSIVVGVLLLLHTLDPENSLHPLLWPTALVAFGIWIACMVIDRGRTQSSLRDTIRRTVCLRGECICGPTGAFQYADIMVLFGLLTLDLTQAELHARGAAADFTVLFGKVRVVVPDRWRVKERRPFVLSHSGLVTTSDAVGEQPVPLVISVLGLLGDARVIRTAKDRSAEGSSI
jgi:hypothetical protein